MNSVILSSLAVFFTRIWDRFKVSAIGRAFFYVCGGISKSWKDSSILTFVRGDNRSYENSVFVKILRLPFAFFEFLGQKIGTFIEKNIKESAICGWGRVYINNFIAINTKFFGIMLLCTGVIYTALKFVTGNGLVITGLIAAVLGAILSLMNFNIMRFLNNSIAVDFIKTAAGYKGLNLEAYYDEYTHGAKRLIIAAIVGIISGMGLYAAGVMGAALPFGIFGMGLVLYAPITGVFFSVFAAPFVPTMALAALVLWTWAAIIIKAVTTKDFKWKFDMTGFGLALLLLVLLISSVLSFAPAGSIKVWMMYLVFVSFYFVIINSVTNEEQLHGLLKLFVISGALVALYGVMQYVFGWTTANAWIDEEMFEDATMRVYSTLQNPNVLGEYLLLVLPVCAAWFLKFKCREIAKWVYALMFLVLALCLILTQSRGCWIGFMVTVFIFVTFYEGKWWGIIPIALLIVPFIIPETMVDRFLSIGNMEDSSTSYRVYIWLGTLGMLRHYWLGGIGMGEAAFNQVYPFFSYNAIQAPHSHNLFLQLTVEAGVIALIIFLVNQIIFAKKMSDVYRLDDKKSTNSTLALSLSAGVIGFLIQSMFDYTFYNYRVMAIFFMVMAMGMCFYHIGKGERV